jgi:3-methyladenine DNA glycosylase/8-oxoguanine DNA glycosylase
VALAPIPRLRLAIADAYGLDAATLDDAAIERVAAPWRPFRSWVLFLLPNRLGAR